MGFYDNDEEELEYDISDEELEALAEADELEVERLKAEERFNNAQKNLEDMIQYKEKRMLEEYKQYEKNKKRKFYNLSPDKSNLKGDSIIEHLGYDKDAKIKGKEQQNFVEKMVKDSKTRMIIYVVAIIIMIVFIFLHHMFF